MKHFNPGKPLLLSVLVLTLFCFSAFAGGEHYTISLNKKLLFVKHISEPVSVMNLLDKTTSSDEIIINYSHCGKQGKGRKVALRNEKGAVVKEWSFSDAKEGMSIPAKEIAMLQKQHGQLTLSYSSAELPSGRALASLKNSGKTFASIMIKTALYPTIKFLI